MKALSRCYSGLTVEDNLLLCYCVLHVLLSDILCVNRLFVLNDALDYIVLKVHITLI